MAAGLERTIAVAAMQEVRAGGEAVRERYKRNET
jgi:hypothetical protein